LSGTHVRLHGETFEWLVSHGFVDPLSVGRVLRALGERAAAADLGRTILSKIRRLERVPTNLEDYTSVFESE
jgi:hypothetical protein